MTRQQALDRARIVLNEIEQRERAAGGTENPPRPVSTVTKRQALERARAALDRIEYIARRALDAAKLLQEDLTQPNYTDEYAAMALCYGEMLGMVRIILDTAVLEGDALDGCV